MPPNTPSVPSRTISFPVSQAQTPTFPFRTGAASYPKPYSPLISSAPLASTPNSQHMPNSRVPSISHAHTSHPQEPASSSTKNPPPAKLGPRMVRMGGTLAQPSTITNAIASGYHAHTPNASLNQFHVYWAPAHLNLADYFTKHHTPSHHCQMRKYFVYTTASPKFLPHAPT